MKPLSWWEILCLVGAAWLIFGGPQGCDLDWPITTTEAGQATWVYEQRAGDPPQFVEAALSELNLREPPVLAEQLDVDLSPLPARLTAVFAAAKAKGLPAFVVSSKEGKVSQTIAGGDLKTKEAVLEAVP